MSREESEGCVECGWELEMEKWHRLVILMFLVSSRVSNNILFLLCSTLFLHDAQAKSFNALWFSHTLCMHVFVVDSISVLFPHFFPLYFLLFPKGCRRRWHKRQAVGWRDEEARKKVKNASIYVDVRRLMLWVKRYNDPSFVIMWL